MSLQNHGIYAIDRQRGPGSDDWLVLAIGEGRLVPVRTDPRVGKDRFAVVVHADPPPSEDALTLLAQLVSDGGVTPTLGSRAGTPCTRWAVEAAARLIEAVNETHAGRTIVA